MAALEGWTAELTDGPSPFEARRLRRTSGDGRVAAVD